MKSHKNKLAPFYGPRCSWPLPGPEA